MWWFIFDFKRKITIVVPNKKIKNNAMSYDKLIDKMNQISPSVSEELFFKKCI